MAGPPDLLSSIGLCVSVAALLALLANRLRQPLLLAYLLAGVLIGPQIGLGLISGEESIRTVSEIGLILLLFIIGLEMDLKKLLAAGKPVLVAGLLQFPLCVALGLAFFFPLGFRAGVAAALTPEGGDLPYQRGGMGDHMAGMAAAGAVAAALLARERTGEGQLVSTSLNTARAFGDSGGRSVAIGLSGSITPPTPVDLTDPCAPADTGDPCSGGTFPAKVPPRNGAHENQRNPA